MLSILKYQSHIDGLRAIAVLSVIIFHLNASWLPGGFVGVDFFFVISGFLITGIIVAEKQRGIFTYKSFYLRRIKRILPALSVVVIVCFIAGYLIFLNYDFRYLRRSTQSTWFFYSNIFFMGEGDYFSQNLSEAPLLHTWSLSIEEQFYFIWPAVLAVIYKYKRNWAIPFCMALICASLSFSVSTLFFDELKIRSYFLLPARFWELLLGGLLSMSLAYPSCLPYLTSISKVTRFLPLLALILLGYSVFFIKEDNGFPGYQAIFPCMSAALFILSGIIQPNNLIVKMLQTKFIVFIGLLSYSLYLWHWPILAFIRYVTIEKTLSTAWMMLFITLTLVLSLLSYQFIEQPFKKISWSFKKSFLLIYILPIVFITSLDLFYKEVLDKKTLHYSENSTSEEIKQRLCPKGVGKGCKLGDVLQNSKVVLIGDSHAEHFVPFFDAVAKHDHWSFRVFSRIACVYFLGVPNNIITSDYALSRKYCADMQDVLAQNIKEEPYTIIFASRWSIHPGINNEKSTLTQTARREIFEKGLMSFLKQGHKIIFVSEVPSYNQSIQRKKTYPNISNDLIRSAEYKEYNVYLKSLANKYNNIFYLDLSSLAEQFTGGAYNGEYMYFDNNHLTYNGSLTLSKLALEKGMESIGLKASLLK